MHSGTTSWVNLLKSSNEYAKAVEDYLDNAFSTRAEGDQISCPCKKCYHRFWYRRDEVYNHLIINGTSSEVAERHFNEKGVSSTSNTERNTDKSWLDKHDDMESLLYDTHRDQFDKFFDSHDGRSHEEIKENASAEAKKFFKLVEDGKQELYPGYKSFSKLSFIVRLYLFKCVHDLTNMAFSELLEIIRDLIPDAKLPESFNEVRKMVKDLGLHYEKIDVCPEDCMLYWKNDKDASSCHSCQTSRWKEVEKLQKNNEKHSSKNASQIPAKVFWYFPLKPRLQRLYMCLETANYMRWHDEKRPKDGNLRHPADGKAWKDFD